MYKAPGLTPCNFSLLKGKPERWTLVKAHGTAVGLPSDDDMGNSEVGHNALGAGRIFAQGYNSFCASINFIWIYLFWGTFYLKPASLDISLLALHNGSFHIN